MKGFIVYFTCSATGDMGHFHEVYGDAEDALEAIAENICDASEPDDDECERIASMVNSQRNRKAIEKAQTNWRYESEWDDTEYFVGPVK